MDIHDVFESTFISCCVHRDKHMTNEEEFRKFVASCKESGIIDDENDEEILRRSWRNARAFKKEGDSAVQYKDFYKELIAIYEKENVDVTYIEATKDLKSSISDAASLVSSWNYDEGGADDVRKLMNKLSHVYDEVKCTYPLICV